MRITPVRMMVFRLLNVTLCRFRAGDALMHRALELVAKPKSADAAPYCQSADFFSYDQLTGDATATNPEHRTPAS